MKTRGGIVMNPELAIIKKDPHFDHLIRIFADSKTRTISNIFQDDEHVTAMLAGTLWESAYLNSKMAMQGASDLGIIVRWSLDPTIDDHCSHDPRNLFYGCPELEGDYDSWDALPTVPAGDVSCRGNCRCQIHIIDKATGNEIDIPSSIQRETDIIPVEQELPSRDIIAGDLPMEYKGMINIFFKYLSDSMKIDLFSKLRARPIFFSRDMTILVSRVIKDTGISLDRVLELIGTSRGFIVERGGYGYIYLTSQASRNTPLHEIAHLMEASMSVDSYRKVIDAYSGWGKNSYVMSHLLMQNRNPREFWAHSITEYVTDRIYMQRHDPRLYEFIESILRDEREIR